MFVAYQLLDLHNDKVSFHRVSPFYHTYNNYNVAATDTLGTYTPPFLQVSPSSQHTHSETIASNCHILCIPVVRCHCHWSKSHHIADNVLHPLWYLWWMVAFGGVKVIASRLLCNSMSTLHRASLSDWSGVLLAGHFVGLAFPFPEEVMVYCVNMHVIVLWKQCT